MKKKLIFILALMFLVIPFKIVNAEEEPIVIATNEEVEKVNHSYFEAGNDLNVKKYVDGISFIAGNIVKFDGVTTYGALAGENVVVNNKIEKDLFAAGNIITISKEAKVGRDVYLAGSEINILSNINGDAYLAGSTIVLDNVEINGNVNVAAENIKIKDNVKITGTLNVNQDVKIENEEKLTYGKKETYETGTKIELKNTVIDIVLSVLTLIFTGVLLSVIFPKLFKNIDSEFNVSNVCKYMIFGFIALIAVPILTILLMGSIVGLTFGIIVILAYIIALLISLVMSSYAVGKVLLTKLFKQNDNLYLDIIVGCLFFKLVSLIPAFGGLIYFIGFLYGFGLIINLFLNRNK